MNKGSTFLGASLAMTLTGCVHFFAQFSLVNAPPHPLSAKAPEAVQVFTLPPSRPSLEIGTVSISSSGVVGGFNNPDHDARVAMLRQEAAKQGCDAIVLRPAADAPHRVWSAACLVYTDAPR